MIAFGGIESHSNYYVIIYSTIMQMGARYDGIFLAGVSRQVQIGEEIVLSYVTP